MRKVAFLFVILLIVGLAGCDGATPSPTAAPAATDAPAPTASPGVPEEAPATEPDGPATCTLAPFEFPPLAGIPPVSEEDHVHGPEDASIVIIEYADFQ